MSNLCYNGAFVVEGAALRLYQATKILNCCSVYVWKTMTDVALTKHVKLQKHIMPSCR